MRRRAVAALRPQPLDAKDFFVADVEAARTADAIGALDHRPSAVRCAIQRGRDHLRLGADAKALAAARAVVALRRVHVQHRGASEQAVERPDRTEVAAPAARITKALSIPTIGIGAGVDCDGQVLVVDDMLGLFTDFRPKFVKRFGELGLAADEAISAYAAEVRARSFPAPEHAFADILPAKEPKT